MKDNINQSGLKLGGYKDILGYKLQINIDKDNQYLNNYIIDGNTI